LESIATVAGGGAWSRAAGHCEYAEEGSYTEAVRSMVVAEEMAGEKDM
jgi:hypothetical protein